VVFFGYICLLVLILLVWYLSGKAEWEPPARLLAKLAAIQAGQKTGTYSAEIMEIPIAEFDCHDLEKEIYLRKKYSRRSQDGWVLDLHIRLSEQTFDAEERIKIKRRLEKRFPGLTVNFLPGEQERKHASVCGN